AVKLSVPRLLAFSSSVASPRQCKAARVSKASNPCVGQQAPGALRFRPSPSTLTPLAIARTQRQNLILLEQSKWRFPPSCFHELGEGVARGVLERLAACCTAPG